MDKPTLYLLIGLIIFSLFGLEFLVFSQPPDRPTHPQIWREYQGFQSMYGSQAWIVA